MQSYLAANAVLINHRVASLVALLIEAAIVLPLAGCGAPPGHGSVAVQMLPSVSMLPTPTMGASDHPVFAIYEERFGRLSQPGRQIHVAVWHDGCILWRSESGMRRGQVEPSKLVELLQRLHREGVFGDGTVYYGSFGPDSSYEVIDVRTPDRRLTLASWHDLFEKNEKTVATSHGIESLEGRNREAVLAAEPEEYRRFRRIWTEIRSTVQSWVPPDGEPFDGVVPLD
jgi:hypothetical protein